MRWKMQEDYSDIINLPHHQSTVRKHMSMHDRASQFASFAALTGYNAAIAETARRTDCRIEPDEKTQNDLNRKVQIIMNNSERKPLIRVVRFVPDEKKAGGRYEVYEGNIRRIDSVYRKLIFSDGKSIALSDVIQIDGDIFDEI